MALRDLLLGKPPQRSFAERARIHEALAWDEMLERWIRRSECGEILQPQSTWTVMLHLYLAWRSQRATALAEIGEATGLDMPQVMRELDALQEHEFVRHWPDEQHPRLIWSELTPEGVDRMNAYFRTRDALQRASRSEREAMLRDLRLQIGGMGGYGPAAPLIARIDPLEARLRHDEDLQELRRRQAGGRG